MAYQPPVNSKFYTPYKYDRRVQIGGYSPPRGPRRLKLQSKEKFANTEKIITTKHRDNSPEVGVARGFKEMFSDTKQLQQYSRKLNVDPLNPNIHRLNQSQSVGKGISEVRKHDDNRLPMTPEPRQIDVKRSQEKLNTVKKSHSKLLSPTRQRRSHVLKEKLRNVREKLELQHSPKVNTLNKRGVFNTKVNEFRAHSRERVLFSRQKQRIWRNQEDCKSQRDIRPQTTNPTQRHDMRAEIAHQITDIQEPSPPPPHYPKVAFGVMKALQPQMIRNVSLLVKKTSYTMKSLKAITLTAKLSERFVT